MAASSPVYAGERWCWASAHRWRRAALRMVGHASAQMSQPGADDDSFTWGCYQLQQQGNQLIAQYGSVGRANPNYPQLDTILQQIRNIGQTWKDIGCETVFGPISDIAVAPVSTNGIARVGGNVGKVQGPVTSAPSGPSGAATKLGGTQAELAH